MGKSPEELKQALVERAQQRRQEAEEIEDALDIGEETLRRINGVEDDEDVLEEIPEEDLDEDPGEELVYENAEEALDALLEQTETTQVLNLVEEEGFTGYLEGAEVEQNPYGEEEVLAEAWAEGWFAAHVQACTSGVLVAAKRLVEYTDEDPAKAAKLLQELEDAVTLLSDTVDYNEIEEFWESL